MTLTTTVPGHRNSIVAIGDSLTHNTELGVPLAQFWPEVLASALRRGVTVASATQKCAVLSRNFGQTGNTTTQMLARYTVMTQYDTPSIALIGTGINDVGTSFATTQANVTSMATSLLAAGAGYVVVFGHHYQNFSSIDTATVEDVNYAPLRAALIAAVAAINASYPGKASFMSPYDYFAARIASGDTVSIGGTSYGPFTQNDAAWHITSGNIHLNAIGQAVFAAGMLAHLQGLSASVLTSLL